MDFRGEFVDVAVDRLVREAALSVVHLLDVVHGSIQFVETHLRIAAELVVQRVIFLHLVADGLDTALEFRALAGVAGHFRGGKPSGAGAVVDLLLLVGGQRAVRQRNENGQQNAGSADPLLGLLLGEASFLDLLQFGLSQLLLVLLLALQALLLFLEQALFCLIEGFAVRLSCLASSFAS